MDEIGRLKAKVQARGDHVAAHMRDDMEAMKRIVNMPREQWTAEDERIIRGTLNGVVGLILEGRI